MISGKIFQLIFKKKPPAPKREQAAVVYRVMIVKS